MQFLKISHTVNTATKVNFLQANWGGKRIKKVALIETTFHLFCNNSKSWVLLSLAKYFLHVIFMTIITEDLAFVSFVTSVSILQKSLVKSLPKVSSKAYRGMDLCQCMTFSLVRRRNAISSGSWLVLNLISIYFFQMPLCASKLIIVMNTICFSSDMHIVG